MKNLQQLLEDNEIRDDVKKECKFLFFSSEHGKPFRDSYHVSHNIIYRNVNEALEGLKKGKPVYAYGVYTDDKNHGFCTSPVTGFTFYNEGTAVAITTQSGSLYCDEQFEDPILLRHGKRI